MKRTSVFLTLTTVCAVAVAQAQPVPLPAPSPASVAATQTITTMDTAPRPPAAGGAVDPFGKGGSFGRDPGLAGLPSRGGVFNYRSWTKAPREGESPAAVVYFTAPTQPQVDEMAEDLRIMSLVLEQNLGHTLADEHGEYKLGIPLFLKSFGHAVEASYFEGFGAVFNLRVLFPLVAPAQPSTPAPTARSSEWERARQALAGTSQAGSPPWQAQNYEPTQPYDTNLVETLKQQTLKLLRNAANLRQVKPDETIVVTFSGPPSAGGASVSEEPGASPSTAAPPSANPAAAPETEDPAGGVAQGRFHLRQKRSSGAQQAPERPTLLTLRIKKSAADDFAAGKLSEEQFLQQAEVTAYLGPTLGGAAPSPAVRFDLDESGTRP